MRNKQPIRDYDDLKAYNANLVPSKSRYLMSEYTIKKADSVNDVIMIADAYGEYTLPLIETIVKFVTSPDFYFTDVKPLANIPFELICALAFPNEYKIYLQSLIDNLTFVGMREVELCGLTLYLSKKFKKTTKWILKAYNSRCTTMYIPDFVKAIEPDTSINRDTFRHVKKIVCYSNTIELGKCAFQGMRNLEEFITPMGITKLGESCFNGCHNLRNIRFASSLKTIPYRAFWNCRSLIDINFPASLKEIEWDAFELCISLSEINLSNCRDLKKIGARAFSACTDIQKVNLSNCSSLVDCPPEAFKNCFRLYELDYCDTQVRHVIIGQFAVNGVKLKKFTFPKNYEVRDRIVFLTSLLESYANGTHVIDNVPEEFIHIQINYDCSIVAKPGEDLERLELAYFLATHSTVFTDAVINGMSTQEAWQIVEQMG